MLILTTRLF